MTENNGEQHLKNILLTFQKKMCVCNVQLQSLKKSICKQILRFSSIIVSFSPGSFKIMTSFPYLKIGSTYAFLAYITYRNVHCICNFLLYQYIWLTPTMFSTYIPQSIMYYHLRNGSYINLIMISTSKNMAKLQWFSKFSPLWHATIGVFLSLSLMWKIDTVNPSSRQCDKLAM